MPTLDEDRAKLKAHFPGESAGQGERWAQLWDQDFLPFDRGAPNPALADTLTAEHELLGGPIIQGSKGKRRRALVPGCGRGYDVLLLASFGYDAYGLEYSKTAVERCAEEQQANASKYPVANNTVGAGEVTFTCGDFFSDQWLQNLGFLRFDLIYDYTFLSALPIKLRPSWAARMTKLLSADGALICLEFPSKKDPALGGPPFALPAPVYLLHLAHPGVDIPYIENGHIIEDADISPSATGLTRAAHWQPERTHDIGKGQDWVSIWKHKA